MGGMKDVANLDFLPFNKTDVIVFGLKGSGDSFENVKKAEEMAERHNRLIKRAADKLERKSKKLGTVGNVLAGISIGSGIYGLKKTKDHEKNSSEKD